MRLFALSLVCLATIGCGHSEEEYRAAIASARRQCEVSAAHDPTNAALAPPHGGCEKDTDCKGDRVCDLGRCTPPPAP